MFDTRKIITRETETGMQHKETNRTIVTVGLLVALFVGALDSMVVTTATASITRDLHGLSLLSWIFSIYTLTTCVSTPIFGKMADLYGRKIIFGIGLGLFLIGSVLCGVAQSMTELIWYRAIQGLGGGALAPVTFTIIADMYTGEQRGKVQGIVASVWSIAGLIGPFVGGFFVDQLTWRWIFYMNIPVAIVSYVLVFGFFHERFEKQTKRKIDYTGALTFMISVSCLLLALLTGGETYAWDSLIIIALFSAFVLFLVLFLVIETKAEEPMLPLSLFRSRRMNVPYMMSFVGFCIVAGVTVYIPLWIQNVIGLSATTSGLLLMPMSMTWPIASTLSGRYMFRFGVKRFMLIGTCLILIGSSWLYMLEAGTPVWQLTIVVAIIGLGMGCISTPALITIQNAASASNRGVATAANSFMGTLGQTVAIAVFGMVFNRIVSEQTPALFADGMHAIFAVIVGLAVVKLVIVLLLPGKQAANDSSTAKSSA